MIRRLVVGAIVAAVAVVVGTGAAGAQDPPGQPEPYRDPPFECEVIDYGTDAPQLPGPADDPLCVRYDKTNATVSTLDILDFLAAEPGRVGIVAVKCAYWQQDSWSVSLAPGTPPLIAWNGSYWYDVATGSAGAVLRDLHVAGQPVSGEAFVGAIRPIVGDETADRIEQFLDDGGGGGLSMQLPDGFSLEGCAGNRDQPTQPDHPAQPAQPAQPAVLVDKVAAQTTDLSTTGVGEGLVSTSTLPSTGASASALAGVGGAAGAVAVLLRCALAAGRDRPRR